jgi:hypothetical protein
MLSVLRQPEIYFLIFIFYEKEIKLLKLNDRLRCSLSGLQDKQDIKKIITTI